MIQGREVMSGRCMPPLFGERYQGITGRVVTSPTKKQFNRHMHAGVAQIAAIIQNLDGVSSSSSGYCSQRCRSTLVRVVASAVPSVPRIDNLPSLVISTSFVVRVHAIARWYRGNLAIAVANPGDKWDNDGLSVIQEWILMYHLPSTWLVSREAYPGTDCRSSLCTAFSRRDGAV